MDIKPLTLGNGTWVEKDIRPWNMVLISTFLTGMAPVPKTSYLAPWGYDNPDFAEGAPGEHIEDRMAKEATAWLKEKRYK
jgi:hypothetical protein